MTEQQDKSREAFEQWAVDLMEFTEGDVAYGTSDVQRAWKTWQAAIATAPPSVEALQKEVASLTELNHMFSCEQAVYLDRNAQLERENEALRTTNAAQVEQLAALEIDVREAYEENTLLINQSIADHEYFEALLQSSSPPEPQAGVELTDEDKMFCAAWLGIDSDHIDKQSPFGNDIRNYIELHRKNISHKSSVAEDIGPADELQTIKDAADFLQHYIDWMYEEKPDLERHPYIPSMQQCVDELRALNQRQAVKAEPSCNHEFHYFGDQVKQRRCVSCNKLEPEPLSAAQGVPEEVARDAARYRWLRNDGGDWYVGPCYETYNDAVVEGKYLNLVAGGIALDSAIDAAMLSAAPEQAEIKEGKK